MIKVFLVDDHKMFREGLKQLIGKEDNLKVVGEAEDGITAIEKIKDLKPNIAVVDISLPDLNGLEVTKEIRKNSYTEVLILSMHSDAFFAINSLKSGAKGYILKEDSFNLLIEAIRNVASGKTFLSPIIETILMNQKIEEDNSINENTDNLLTKREMQILQMIAEGYTNNQIAEKLFLSIRTVDTHRKNIMKKLNIHNVSGLVKYAIKHKIITL